jgi:His/Glu/Gln/Arg/opine family amino acid ABC transporter permease subunit
MADTDNKQTNNDIIYVEQDVPETRKPPALETGVFKWMRENLFGSLLDTFLTFAGLFLIITSTISFFVWAIQDANWFAISFNFRQFMIGRYAPQYEWRIQIAVLFVAVASGAAIAVWIRQISRTMLAAIGATMVMVWIVPPIIFGVIPLPPSYVAAGNVEIQSGSATESALSQVAFIAREGETIQFNIVERVGEGDNSLANLAGFMSVATNTLRNAAQTRLQTIDQKEQLEELLVRDTIRRLNLQNTDLSDDDRERLREEFTALELPESEIEDLLAREDWEPASTDIPILTENQRTELADELADIEIATPIVEQYNLNEPPITVQVYDATGDELQPLADDPITLSEADDVAGYEIPADGWYVIEKQIGESDLTAISVLAADGVYPILQSSSYDPDRTDAEGNVVGGFVDSFTRMTDNFEIVEPIPRIDDEELPITVITDNQYRGDRPFTDYLRVYTAPFLSDLAFGTTLISLFAIVGYLLTRAVARSVSSEWASRIATYLLIASPVVIWVMVNGTGMESLGLGFSDPRNWGGLLLTMMLTIYGIIIAFPIGIGLALGRRSDLPAVKYFCTAYIEIIRGSPFITVLFFMQLLIPLINSDFATVPNSYRAMIAVIMFSAAYLAENVRGGLQSVPEGQSEAARALGLSNWQTIRLITLPQALRAVIPALVGQFISLFKDTSLVAIVGLIDLVGFVNTMVVQAQFIGTRLEGLLFISIIYFVFSYIMSYVSRLLEASGSGSTRRM